MPKSKHQFRRYELLDRCISNTGRRWYFQDLLEEINEKLLADGYEGVGERSLRQDLVDLEEEYHAPIERVRDGRKIYYRYSDPDYSFTRRPLTEEEAHQLSEAIRVLGSFEGLPQFDWIQELTAKLESEFDLKPENKTLIQFDTNLDLKGLSFFTPLYNGISQRRVFWINYKPYPPKDPFELTFHPYFLKQYNNRWFVLGWNEEVERNFLLALDRIREIHELDAEYKSPGEFDFQDFFDQVVGVTVPQNELAQKVLLRFFKPAIYYVETKPLHLSQKRPVWQEDGSALIEIDVIPNYELIQQILFYGDQVEVISPESLRKSLAGKVGNMWDRYF
jgi:predicted DNA-binding transcriptional regulator YafY